MEDEYSLPFEITVSVCVVLGLRYETGEQYSPGFWTNHLVSVMMRAKEPGDQNLSQNSDEFNNYIKYLSTLVRVKRVSSGGVTGAKIWFRTPVKRLNVKGSGWDEIDSQMWNNAKTSYQKTELWEEHGSVEMKELVMKFENGVPTEEWPGDE
jgi:hypothetical protein